MADYKLYIYVCQILCLLLCKIVNSSGICDIYAVVRVGGIVSREGWKLILACKDFKILMFIESRDIIDCYNCFVVHSYNEAPAHQRAPVVESTSKYHNQHN